MRTTLRVLIVEDSEDDAMLLLQALRRGAWKVTHERVDTPAAMSAALDKGGWDLIIADYSMPQFSGPAALALAIGRASDLPFILISGAVGEETAVQSMKAGADDYISKGNLARLVHVVERELHKADGLRDARRIEEQLRRRETHLAYALKLAQVGTWHLDMRNSAAVWSDEACRIIGFKVEQSAPAFEDLLARLYPKDRTVLTDLLRHPDTKQFAQDLQMIRADGAAHFVHIRGDIIRDGNAVPLEAAGMIQDITDRRLAEQELELSEVRYRRMFESSQDGILLLDAQSAKVLDVNRFMVDLLGYSREYFLGKELWEIGVFKDAESSKTAMLTLQRLGGIRYEDLPLEHADGRQIPVEFVSNVYREGRRSVIQCNIRDITERKRFERALQEKNAEMENANLAKDRFLASMSHELRTPLNAILGFTGTLLMRLPGPLTGDQEKQLRTVKTSGKHLLSLINDLLDLAKIESGKVDLNQEEVVCQSVLDEVKAALLPLAAAKSLAFEVKTPRPDVKVRTDRRAFTQILLNLVNNAIKFTEKGGIAVNLERGGSNGDSYVTVRIVDTGIGIRAEDQTHLFQAFEQVTAGGQRHEGTGLGLHLSQKLAILLGGRLDFISEFGKGSTFTFTLKEH
jgi:PAS domain S-box-containing protein